MNTTAKYTLIIVGATLAAFAVALVGAYFALPTVAPGAVAQSDSTTMSDSTVSVAQSSAAQPSAAESSAAESSAAESSTAPSPVPADSARSTASAGDTSTTDTAPSATAINNGPGPNAKLAAALRDSLQNLRQRLRKANEKTASLREETKTLRQQLSAAETRRVKTDELSSALLKMEKRELAALLEEVEMHVLEQLYQEASGRSRTHLLQSMPPARAARFVNQLVEDQGSETPTSAVASSPSTPPSE